ncbi:hypothetical protein BC830DRAFT_1175520 [Chytriomyces sp. MP71]|nr:hypothetical protein BC830DRAFT_1175520 [Chytriomyces sp. MP71]
MNSSTPTTFLDARSATETATATLGAVLISANAITTATQSSLVPFVESNNLPMPILIGIISFILLIVGACSIFACLFCYLKRGSRLLSRAPMTDRLLLSSDSRSGILVNDDPRFNETSECNVSHHSHSGHVGIPAEVLLDRRNMDAQAILAYSASIKRTERRDRIASDSHATAVVVALSTPQEHCPRSNVVSVQIEDCLGSEATTRDVQDSVDAMAASIRQSAKRTSLETVLSISAVSDYALYFDCDDA